MLTDEELKQVPFKHGDAFRKYQCQECGVRRVSSHQIDSHTKTDHKRPASSTEKKPRY